jgi:hypothetical protein
MDVLLFVKIVAWFVAVGATLISGIGILLFWRYTFTAAGRIEQMVDAMKGRQYQFRWSTLFLAILSWIAIYSFR